MAFGRETRRHKGIAVFAACALTACTMLSGCIPTSSSKDSGSYTKQQSTPVVKTNHNAFRITDVSVTSNGKSSKVATGTIKNNDTESHTFAYIKVSFLDSDMDVVSVEGLYAVGKEGLSPGESTTWRVHTDYNSKITSARAEVVDYD